MSHSSSGAETSADLPTHRRPPAIGHRRPCPNLGSRLPGAAVLVLLAGCAREQASSVPATPTAPATAKARPGLLETRPRPVELGRLRPGQVGHATLLLENPGPAAITVARVETSCPCVRLLPVPALVEPGGHADVEVLYDPREEPEFRGKLAVEVTGLDRAGVEVLKTSVRVEVAD